MPCSQSRSNESIESRERRFFSRFQQDYEQRPGALVLQGFRAARGAVEFFEVVAPDTSSRERARWSGSRLKLRDAGAGMIRDALTCGRGAITGAYGGKVQGGVRWNFVSYWLSVPTGEY